MDNVDVTLDCLLFVFRNSLVDSVKHVCYVDNKSYAYTVPEYTEPYSIIVLFFWSSGCVFDVFPSGLP